MERTGSLIKRLQELYESKASATSLLATAQLLIRELKQHSDAETPSSKIVSVILPEINFLTAPETEAPHVTIVEKTPVVIEEPIVSIAPADQEEIPVLAESLEKKVAPLIPAFLTVPRFDEIPTIAYQQKEVFELNDAVGFKE